ncbi:MAG: hypothetical protein CVV31_09265 [Methanomicrobiales archaeon HGW-Methanomicrobiales-2]|jgi:hypothetical protein|nr:MAG: hypothetical protein CVV31_09265 [Methanomicrobiales archaeon HGW-Methanomicrobiales-2]
MTDIRFGTIVSAVLECLDFAESDLTGDERRDSYKALQHYKRDVAQAIREAFDEAEVEIPAAVQPTCSTCGAPVEEGYHFCTGCRTPQTPEAAVDILEKVFAKELGRNPYDPRFREALARAREEAPDQWAALVQKITVPVKA